MAKKSKGEAPYRQQTPVQANTDKPATLKDLLNADIVQKLKQSAEEMKAEEARKREEKRKQEEAVRKAEEKRLENDFAHLLQNDKTDWRKFK